MKRALIGVIILAILISACGATATPTTFRATFPSLTPTHTPKTEPTATKTHPPLVDQATVTPVPVRSVATVAPSTPTSVPPTATSAASIPATVTRAPLANTATPLPQPTQAPIASACPSGCAVSTPPPGCDIKGNISDKGEKIYHVRGGASYTATIINSAQGERWFCTEAEARAADWRKAEQ